MANESIGLINPLLQFTDEDGVPYASGTLGFYVVGTGTLQDVYSDAALTTPLTNPVPLNAAGRTSTSSTGPATPVYLQQKTYDVILKDSAGVTIYGPITVSGSQWPGQVQGQAILSPAANADGYTNRFTTTINKASSGVHALFAGTRFDKPTIGAGASTLTEAATVYIADAPATGTNKYALHVAAGTSLFSGDITATGAVTGFGGITDTCDGRLTLTSGTPVTTSDVTGASAVTIYFAPYKGYELALYDGTTWHIRTFTEISIAVPATTATAYDVFVYDNAGTATLELTAWTNVTTRATALTTQNGVLVKTGAVTRRYVGSFLTTGASGQTEDSAQKRYLFNYYNRVRKTLQYLIATNSWTYTTATIRQANADTANQVEIMNGFQDMAVNASYISHSSNPTANVNRLTGIGQNSTTAATGIIVFEAPARTGILCQRASLSVFPAVGYSYFPALEYSAATDTTTWYGDNNQPTLVQSGLQGDWWC